MNDIDLTKGTTIATATAEELTGIRRTEKGWQLALLGLRDHIERAYFEKHRVLCTVRITQDTLRICTDAEASALNEKRFRSYIKRAAKTHARNTAVDESNLTERERNRHRRTVEVQSKVLGAASRARREFKAEVPKRLTPGLKK